MDEQNSKVEISSNLEKRQAISNYAYEQPSEKVNSRLTQLSKIFQKKIYKTKENIYTAYGYAVDAPVMIVGEDGIIVIDPCESYEAMEEVVHAFRQITMLPVKAILYTHHHPDHWAGVNALFPGVENVKQYVKDHEISIIAHRLFIDGVAKESGMLVDIKTARSLYMYGSLLPASEEGRVNIGNGPSLENGRQDLLLPNCIVDQQLRLTVAGVDMEVYHIPSECSDEICVWFPQQKVLHVAECVQGENYPNIYSIRGSNRNPIHWMESIDFMRMFPAECLVGNHIRPVEGKSESSEHLTDYRDMIQYTHDQTVRLINKGYTPENIIKELQQLPPHLYQRPRIGEHYGTFIQGIRLVFNTHVGWFNGDAIHLQPHDPNTRSKRYIDAIGKERCYEIAECAFEEKDYKWCIELASHLITLDQEDMRARHIKAKGLRELGYLTENAPFRNWYITQALNLEGQFDEIKKSIPEFESPGVYIPAILNCPPKKLMDIIRVKLNGPKAQKQHYVIRFELSDKDYQCDIEIRRGICEVHEGNTRDVVGMISMTQHDFAVLFTQMTKVSTLMNEGRLQTNLEQEKVTEFFALFDGFTPLFDMVYPFQ